MQETFFYCRYFRAYESPALALPTRLASGSDGAIWLIHTRLGVYRGVAFDPEGPSSKPALQATCGDVDEKCADGGCNAAMKACTTCAAFHERGQGGKVGAAGVLYALELAAPKNLMTCATLQCRFITAIDPFCDEILDGTVYTCLRCRSGYEVWMDGKVGANQALLLLVLLKALTTFISLLCCSASRFHGAN